MTRRQRRRAEKKRRHERIQPTARGLAAGAGLTVGATLAAAGTAHAADFTVTNLNDSGPGSLRQAIFDANSNPGSDRVLFASGLSGTITLGGELYIFDATQVLGPGADQITVNGAGVGRDLVVAPYFNGQFGDPVTISGLTLTGGQTIPSADGGGVFSIYANLTVADSVITGNHAGDDGGGIFSYNGAVNKGSLTVRNSTLSGNTAGDGNEDDAYGGGIAAYGTPMTVGGSTISGNTAGEDGGGIYTTQFYSNSGPNSLSVTNSTISGNNTAGADTQDNAGGIWFCCSSTGDQMTLDSATISGNSTTTYGGGVTAFTLAQSQVTINNTIIANNSAPSGPGPDIYSTYGGLLGFSLIEDFSNSTDTGQSFAETPPGSNIIGQDPQLQPLAANGGPTQTQALASTSPAVDKGNTTLTTDQRGLTRPFDFASTANAAGGNGADIGAFELAPTCQGKAPTIVARAGQTTVGTAGPDVIVGTDARDVIKSGKGKDTVCARSGNDKVSAGKGKDSVNGDKGKDKLLGGKGGDTLRGGKGRDKLFGGRGNDKLKGGPGRDKLVGGPGRDRLNGGPGRDRIKQ